MDWTDELPLCLAVLANLDLALPALAHRGLLASLEDGLDEDYCLVRHDCLAVVGGEVEREPEGVVPGHRGERQRGRGVGGEPAGKNVSLSF